MSRQEREGKRPAAWSIPACTWATCTPCRPRWWVEAFRPGAQACRVSLIRVLNSTQRIKGGTWHLRSGVGAGIPGWPCPALPCPAHVALEPRVQLSLCGEAAPMCTTGLFYCPHGLSRCVWLPAAAWQPQEFLRWVRAVTDNQAWTSLAPPLPHTSLACRALLLWLKRRRALPRAGGGAAAPHLQPSTITLTRLPFAMR